MRARRAAGALALLLACAGLAGCATVPSESPVQILRRVTAGEEGEPPPGPADGIDPLGLVRTFVEASASSADQHAAARQFLADPAQDWDDGASLTVLDSLFDTVPAPGAPDPSTGVTRVRIRGTAVGRLSSSGSFEPGQGPVQSDVTLVRSAAGQWRISELPAGVLVPLQYFREEYRPVRTWFVDPARRLAVPDQRHIPAFPQAAQVSRVLDLLLAGPSGAALGSVTSQLQQAGLRSNVGQGENGEVVVDLTQVGELDDVGRRLLAAQVVLSLAEVNVQRVRLLVDGIPLLADRPVLTRDDVADLNADVQPGADVPALVAAGGRLRALAAVGGAQELAGPVGDGTYDIESAASSVDGSRLAAVTRFEGRRQLLVGGGAEGGVATVGLTAGSMTRPSWSPAGSEVWTVLDGSVVARVLVDGAVRTGQVNADELVALGPVQDLRLSRDGMRVAAVVDGGLWTGAVTRSVDGEVAIRNVRRLRPADLTEVVAVDWRASESLVVVTRRPDRLVVQVTVDGLQLSTQLVNNLTPPLTAVAAAPNRPLLVTDQSGVWSFGGGQQDAWRQVLGGAPEAKPQYPG
ncbi:MAG: LpqB family beta-propeller domain-containing protein [Pseudonocardiales bacterium]|nr:LpqB family beta-propeller domain-containing protein [Pseudonocardiales bacterium]